MYEILTALISVEKAKAYRAYVLNREFNMRADIWDQVISALEIELNNYVPTSKRKEN